MDDIICLYILRRCILKPSSELNAPTRSNRSTSRIWTLLKPSGSGYGLNLFTADEIAQLDVIEKGGKCYLKCIVTGKDRVAYPEEIVRQLYLWRLLHVYKYPIDRIEIEKSVQFGSSDKGRRADIVISDKDNPDTAYVIVELKKPKRRDGMEQLKSYCNAEGSPIGVWTNGAEIVYLHREEPNLFKNLPDIPRCDQKLSDLLSERWDIERLTKENRLVNEQLTLKSVILDMEDLVLANAGVDAFEEVFKLIYAKLYDEWNASRPGKQRKYLDFRIGGSTPKEFYVRISNLFNSAKEQWPGVFLVDEKIELTPQHLVTCGSFLEDIKLFNSNLQIIDEAFEYLAIQVGKGSKGQYFTPRHVIDMCVDMLNPSADDFIIDTASGSCGFTVHSIFKVWGNQFTALGPNKWQSEYASTRVFGMDYDPRSVKIAKALNLIAGDGRTNVYRANTLDPRNWSEETRVGLRNRLSRFPDDPSMDDYNQKNFRFFDFDILLTNPPFAGEIKDGRILHQFDLSKKITGKWQDSVGRDILFIERNLEFLRPGGRMCIVLPQGRLNNDSDQYIRDFISNKARIVAVVGLHPNTFKPHTGTKTSVLFLQKWNDNPRLGALCPVAEDYPIFFAVSHHGGKDNSGEYTFKRSLNGEFVLDNHGHMTVQHDLDEIVGAFIKFAKRQHLSFWEDA